MAKFKGFMSDAGINVPDALLGSLLEDINDLTELKCTLRVLWHIGNKSTPHNFTTFKEMTADVALHNALKYNDRTPLENAKLGLDKAVRRGTLLSISDETDGIVEKLYFLNDDAGRKTLGIIEKNQSRGYDEYSKDQYPPDGSSQPNIFSLYEENIGLLTPLIADELKDAESSYPWNWIEEAFKIAVSRNVRNWNYVSRILDRWKTQGKNSGEPSRNTSKVNQTADFEEYLHKRRA